jgi:AcrR family transcriptional regulator
MTTRYDQGVDDVSTREDVHSRRHEYSEATRRALLDSAAELFVRQGFSHTSLDQVAADARVTKGAIYHHFPSKQALFEAVSEEAEEKAGSAIVDAVAKQESIWDGAIAGLDEFLDQCLDPAYQRICFRDGPSVMGFDRWWEFGERHVLGMMEGVLERLRDEGFIEVAEVSVLAQLLYGSLSAAALAIARSSNPKATRDEMRDVTVRLVGGLRPS